MFAQNPQFSIKCHKNFQLI